MNTTTTDIAVCLQCGRSRDLEGHERCPSCRGQWFAQQIQEYRAGYVHAEWDGRVYRAGRWYGPDLDYVAYYARRYRTYEAACAALVAEGFNR